VLNTQHLLRKPVCGLKAPLGLSCPAGTAVLSGSLLARKRERTRRQCFLQKALNSIYAKTLCTGSKWLKIVLLVIINKPVIVFFALE
jgi:hypothetical protein